MQQPYANNPYLKRPSAPEQQTPPASLPAFSPAAIQQQLQQAPSQNLPAANPLSNGHLPARPAVHGAASHINPRESSSQISPAYSGAYALDASQQYAPPRHVPPPGQPFPPPSHQSSSPYAPTRPAHLPLNPQAAPQIHSLNGPIPVLPPPSQPTQGAAVPFYTPPPPSTPSQSSPAAQTQARFYPQPPTQYQPQPQAPPHHQPQPQHPQQPQLAPQNQPQPQYQHQPHLLPPSVPANSYQQIPPQHPAAPMPHAASAAQISQQQQQQSSQKISAAQMPNVVAVQEADQARYYGDAVFKASLTADILPPLPTTDLAIVDDGNCSPRFMRITTYHVPVSEDLCSSSRIPLAIVTQPFAKQDPREAPIPVVDFGESGPVRCTRCRAYINVFVRFLKGGRTFECNICSINNDVPEDYFCNIDASGRRVDIANRPELLFGSVDFAASKEYVLRKPDLPYLLFAVDSSRAAVQNGAFFSSLQAIRMVAQRHLQGERLYAKIALITFDKAIHAYDLRTSEAQILVMSDVHEPFVPLHDGLFFDPAVSSEQLFALLDRLPGLYNETRVVDSCLGAASAFALEAMQSHGGRIVVFSTTLPSIGIGMLRNRDTASQGSSDKVNPLVIPQGDFYSKTAKKAASFGVSYVLVSTPSAFMDLATIGQLSTLTSGHTLHYPKFGFDRAGKTLITDLTKFLFKPFVYDAVLRVRAGSGLQTSEYFGNFFTLNQTDYQFASLDCDQTLACSFIYDSKLSENDRVSFQCAILYTSTEGQRRIRVHNLAVPVTSVMANVFRMADLDALLQFSCKRSISQITTVPFSSLVSHMHIRSAQILGAYRKFCASSMPSGQLVLPESFKLLPLFCLALSKSSAFSQAINNLASISLRSMPIHLYPRLFPLHRLLEQEYESFPSQLRLSQEVLEAHGIYLLENGSRMLLWVGNMVDPELLSRMFGVGQLSSINSAVDSLPELNNSFSSKARSLIQKIQQQYSKHLPLQIIRQSLDPAEVEWQSSLIEDGQTSLGPSYVDFLCRLHNQITHEINAASLAEKTAILSFLQ